MAKAKKSVPAKKPPKKVTRKRRKRSGAGSSPDLETKRKQNGRRAGGRGSIRVYRHGLGDCILVRLKREDESDYKILIDCGVAVATKDAATTMKNVMNDVLSATEERIDVLAVTHEHWDHLSGFSQAKAEFGRLKVGEVWLAWTEDEKDDLARTLRKERDDALQALSDSAARLKLAGTDDSLRTSSMSRATLAPPARRPRLPSTGPRRRSSRVKALAIGVRRIHPSRSTASRPASTPWALLATRRQSARSGLRNETRRPTSCSWTAEACFPWP